MMNLLPSTSKLIKGPFLDGCFSISVLNSDKALKILSGTGCEENFLVNHNTGFSNMVCKNFRINYFTAIMLISTFANFGRAETWTVSLAGKLLLKYFP